MVADCGCKWDDPRDPASPWHPDIDVDLGDDHLVAFYLLYGDDPADAPAGCHVWHRNPGDPAHWCLAGIAWRHGPDEVIPSATWELVSLEPLHTEPSLLCHCGDHGWIRAGRWVRA